MIDVESAADWDRTSEALYAAAGDGPPDIADRLRALPPRPGRDGSLHRDNVIARVFTVLFNCRHYALAREVEAALGLRARTLAKTAGGAKLTDAGDQNILFGLGVLDSQRGGDPVRAKESFETLRRMLPPGHHLINGCLDGEAVATRLISQRVQTVETEKPPGLLVRLGLMKPRRVTRKITFKDICAVPDESLLPWLDRADLDERGLSAEQRSWRRDGVLVLRDFIPRALIDAYVARRSEVANTSGWLSASSYQHVPEMRALALYPPLMAKLKHLLGEEMLLHLALTGWVSTERDWHQDDYLNPDFVMTCYSAVWMALDTISPDSGPFEYIPGSHRWPLMSGTKVRSLLTQEERDRREGTQGVNHWEVYAERFVTPAIEAEIAARGVRPVQFIAGKGDVLLWHARLMHRGTAPRRPNLERRSLITHYSGVNHRPDMPQRVADENGQRYALFEAPLY